MDERSSIGNSILAGIVMITAENFIRKVFEYFSDEHDKKVRAVAKEEAYKAYNEIAEYQAKAFAAQRAQEAADASARVDTAASTSDDEEEAAGRCATGAE